jgi:hypothetical protein
MKSAEELVDLIRGTDCLPDQLALVLADRNAVLETAAQVADSHQDEPWGKYKNWHVSQVAAREIRDKIRELKE